MASSEMNHKPKTTLRVIRNLLLDIILYFAIVYIKKSLLIATSAEGIEYKIHNRSLKISKKSSLTNNLLYFIITIISIYTKSMEIFELSLK